ncbi:MAG TPA: hypothetical protein VL989_01525 [Candidatus Sulfotelmatobacter sp.]|nr:hypothetical protein [Candidatus Sulfotelmatobacter sp.]
MRGFLIFLLVISIILLVGGLAKPGKNKRTGKPYNRRKIAIYFGSAVVVLIILTAITAPSNKTTASKGSTASTSTNPPVSLDYVTNKNDGAFITVTAVINPSQDNHTILPKLCKYFSQQAAANPNEMYQANIFDDNTAPQYLGNLGSITTAQNNDFSNHYILSYNYNYTTHNNICNITYGGTNDNNPSDNQSITY